MKPGQTRTAVGLAACALALLVGGLVFRMTRPAAGGDGARVAAAVDAPRLASRASDTLVDDDGTSDAAMVAEEARVLARFLDQLTASHAFGRDRQAALREMLEGAPPRVVEALLRAVFGDEALNDVAHVLIETLARIEPGAALAFAREHGFAVDPPWWDSVIAGLPEPRAALADVVALADSPTRNGFFGHIAMRLAETDPDAALAFAQAEVPAEARATTVGNAIIAISRADAERGIELAIQHGMVNDDPFLIRGRAVDWAMDDYAAAARRLRALDDGLAREIALEGLASVAIGRGPEAALEAISWVKLPEARVSLLHRLALDRHRRDPATAEAWLAARPEYGEAERTRAREAWLAER